MGLAELDTTAILRTNWRRFEDWKVALNPLSRCTTHPWRAYARWARGFSTNRGRYRELRRACGVGHRASVAPAGRGPEQNPHHYENYSIGPWHGWVDRTLVSSA